MLASSALRYVGARARSFKLNNFVLNGCQVVDFLIIFADSRSMKKRFNGSFVCLCLTFVMFLTTCPSASNSLLTSSVSVV